MSFPRYPKYKASGVEWLGEVPEGWEVKRARAVGVFSSSGIDKKSVDGEQAVQMFNYLDVYKSPDKTLRYSEDLMWTTAPASKVAEHSVVLDDILLTPSSETADDIGHAARVTSVPPNILYSYHILRFRKGAGFDASFVTHCFNAVPIRSYFESVCTGTTRKVLVRDDFKNAPFAIPPLPEQTVIAEFLDRETAKIDGLVAVQRRLMELLKEKRQAVISHAVTKGLNPHAPMKPSGIEWLGDVPAGWTVRKVSQLFRAGKGKNGQMLTKEFCGANEGEYPVYSGQTENEGVMGTWDQFEFDFGEAGVLFSTTVGAKAMHLRQLFGRFSLSQNCMIIWTTSTLCITRFFYYHFQPLFQWQRSMIPDHMQPSFRMEDLYACAIALPPTDEQSAIVRYLDSELAKFDTLTAEAQRAIDLLQERRTALISAAVTGQIDVRQQPRN